MKTRLLCALVLAGCGLAACESLYQDDRAKPQPAKAPTPVQEAVVKAPVPAPPPPKPRVRARPPPSSAAEPSPIAVVGLSRPEVLKTLGSPAERAEHAPGQSWVYHASGCTLEVLFLYDVTRNDMFAIDRKIGGTDGSARAEQQCLQRIKAANAS